MASVDQYANYSAIQLATEAAFIAWVKCPGADSDFFWSEYLSRYPLQAGPVEKARAIVLQMRVVQEAMDENRAATVWDRISSRIAKLPADRMRGRVVVMRRWWAAAAVLVFIVCGLWFIVGRNRSGKPSVAVAPKAKQDIAPGGDKAILTLADGTKVVLDTADNGAITKQGNVTVIKLNGQLAYNKQGSAATEVLYNTITTPRGGQYQLVLADGSKVWLNAASSIRFPAAFTGNERRVEITGEAYFEVAHDAAKPFHVKVNDMEVQVLGTHFNINAYEDEPSLKVTLLEGRVNVRKGSEAKLLEPGQQAVIAAGASVIAVEKDVDMDHVVSWKNGLFDFDNDPLPVVMRQLARWYDATVVYTGAVPEGHYTGAIRRQARLSEVLKMLELAGGVQFSIEGKRIVVQRKLE